MTIEETTVAPTLFERATQHAISAPRQRVADPTREKLLVAAYEQFCIDGVAGASMEDVAKRAGTSRITIYRKFDSKDALVDEVIAHELAEYFRYFQEAMTEADTFAERLVTGFVTSIQQIWSNPLIKRLIADDPALVPGLVGGGGGRNMYAVSEFVATALHKEQKAGNLDESIDPEMAAEMIARITGSFVTTPGGQVELDDSAQLEQLARSYLLPMLKVTES